ncbi:hypothetical protein BKA64DRAFT_655458 [Cadophora sp. MPI-SDFR-AT-0126]|nr:hypothetical protein BKA64DRAFT_655458 [Leotiomycetes sp. MPI-SDFR-AT-0126]
MKYGQTFYAQSVPQWAPYNVDYDELKNLIKVNTTKDQAQAIAIPGQADPSLEKFETAFFNDFSSEHDRVELFVKSKADEISRRLHMHSLCELDGCCYPVPEYLQKVVLRLLARTTRSSDRDISQNQRDRIANYHVQIER